ncbi:MAG: RluA family pseudouridine synthase [Tepidisphaerales bacterium]
MSTLPDDDFLTDSPEDDTSADVVHFRWKVTKNLTRRLDQYLVDRVGYLSRAGVQRVIRDGLVTVNGKPAKASYHPQNGDVVEMFAPPEPVNELVPEPIPLDIVYEDEHFLALNKQADLIVHPARGKWTGTLVNGLVYYGNLKGFTYSSGGVRPENLAPPPPPGTKVRPASSAATGNWRPGILHRLDRNTTGIMLVAKSEEAHWRLARQFENRTIQKTYLALCHGIPEPRTGFVDAPIGRDKYVREKMAVRKIESGAKEALTLYEVLQGGQLPLNAAGDGSPRNTACALVKLTPKTGRTHQLRVHMAHLGHPMIGDTLYGGSELHLPPPIDFHFTRQALHAYEISFLHPATLQPMTLSAPLPPDFTRLLELLQ